MNALLNLTTFKKLLLGLLLVFTSQSIVAQCTGVFTIFTEDFEDHGNTANGGAGRYASPNDFHEGILGADDDYWGRIEGSTTEYFLTNTSSGFPTHANTAYSGWNGSFYYAGEDLDDIGGSIGTPDGLDIKEISFSSINIDGATNMCFSVLVAAGDNLNSCGSSVYDDADYIEVYYEIDAGGEILAMCFNPDLECNIPGDITNEPLYYDNAASQGGACDGDGGGGTLLTSAFQEFTFNIAGTGTSMNIRIEVHMDSGNEEVAIDYLRVRSDTDVVMPIDLVSFGADKAEENVKVSWVTLSEENNDRFEIEHSIDGNRFEKIGTVQGAGISYDKRDYQFMHDTPVYGLNYYRMKQVDFDGTSSYSDIASVRFEGERPTVNVMPNPFTAATELYLSQSFDNDTKVVIYNALGQAVFTTILERDAFKKELDLSILEGGIYILQIGEGSELITKRIIKN